LDYVDACDLDTALSRRAGELKAAGSEESLDVRRSIAAGDLARGYDSLPFDDDAATGGFETGLRPSSTTEVVVHVHEDLDGVGGWATPGHRCSWRRSAPGAVAPMPRSP
ncbi:MAG: hypothetical protein JWM84_1779, partial [Nocardioides sp.]|nr:hypothetical protein [Nocardioides sp.]